MALSIRAIQAALPGAVIRDTLVPGFYLAVSPSGKRSFYLYFRTKDGRERRPKLGDFGVLSVDQARTLARSMLADVAAGKDPMAERADNRSAPTMADLCARYLEDYANKYKKPKSIAEDNKLILGTIIPRLGTQRVKDVQHEEIDDLHGRMKDTPYQANRALALLSKMFNLAEKWKLRPIGSNPCIHVRRYTERKRKRYMTSDEAPAIAEKLRLYETQYPDSVAFIYLLVLTGARPDEIARARPEWIEQRPMGAVLNMPDSKTGARLIYLPPQVMRLLDNLPSTRHTLTGIQSPRWLWNRIRKETGIKSLRLYDLRHTFASAALRAGYTLEQIGELLGHSNTQTTKRYAHLIDEKAQEAAANTANVLEGMLLRQAC